MPIITPRQFGLLQIASVTLLGASLAACGDTQSTRPSSDTGTTSAPTTQPSSPAPMPDAVAPPATPATPATPDTPSARASEPATSGSPTDPGRLTVLSPIALELPDGWRVDGAPRPLRLATLRPQQEDAQLEIILTVMAGAGPLDLANVNRWRQQVGMGPVATLDGEQIEPINAELNGYLYTLLADSDQAPGSMVAALQLGENRRIYLRMAGLTGQIREHADAFHAVVHSVRPE